MDSDGKNMWFLRCPQIEYICFGLIIDPEYI